MTKTRVNNSGLLERYQRLIETSRDLASTLDLDMLLNRIVLAAAELCGAQAASILLYDDSKHELHFSAASNQEEPSLRGFVVPVEGSIAGWIVENRQPIVITDIQNHPRHFKLIREATKIKTTCLLGVPLIAKEKVVGVLEVINKRSGEFTEEDLELLMALGAQAAVAIENSRLFLQSDLISEMVHELRTPMTSLNTAAQLLQRPDITSETRSSLVEMILGETNRLAEMTSVFLDLARLESGRAPFQPQMVDVRQLLEDCFDVMQSKALEKDILFYLDVPEKLPFLLADNCKLKQLVLNLLSNAIKYNRPEGRILVSAQVAAEEMIIRMSDTGVGIPAESISHIFSKFYRVPGSERTAQGTGLGLSICKRIVDLHHGRIEVQSQVGQGTLFEIGLPLRGKKIAETGT